MAAERFPFAAGIEVTRRCNFTCHHCFVDAGKPLPDEADTQEIMGWLDALEDLGADGVGWSGGEPLLRQDLVELTAYASGRGFRVGLASNGFLATRARLRALQDAGLGVVQVSVDGTTPARANRFRQGPRDAFSRAVRAVEESARLGLQTYVCTLLSPETAPEVEEMVAFSRELGAVGLRYTMWAPVGRAQGQAYDEAAWGSPAVKAFLDQARTRPWGSPFPVLVDCPTGPLPHHDGYRCTAGKGTCYLTATGDVYPCTALMQPGYLVGNTRETPLQELLVAPRMTRVHGQRARSLPGGACATCDVLETCRGGCPGRTVAAVGRVRGGPQAGAMPVCLRRIHGKKTAAPRRARGSSTRARPPGGR
jgi:radical SAM protein with 4Fe4S-binding SPASM domain